jgi:aspartyl-tRNA(Asn)/glutamyl-tRNA(Gln) amidotransferase subunit A
MRLKQLRRSLDERQISAAELAKEYLARAKADSLNALITVTEEAALEQAETAQRLIDSGKATALTGIPCVLKDNICTAGIRTTCGSKMLEEFVPFYDAELVQSLKAQGFVLIGKANMDEFAMGNSNRTSHFGNVHNPRDSARTPGGSSGGNAAAVAAGLCAYGIGTDTGGSVRQPAAHCGITGLKPTYGRISRHGVAAFAGSFDTVGILAESAEDCGAVLSGLMGGLTGELVGGAEALEALKGLRVALVRELFTESVDENVRAQVTAKIDLLRKHGAIVSEVSMPILPYAAPAYFCLASAEAVSAMARYDGVKYGLRGEGATYDEQLRDSRTRGFGDEVKRRILLGNLVLSGENMQTYYRKATMIRQQVIREFDGVFADADVIISPTSARTAFELSEPSDYVKIYASTMYTVPMNLAGLPCAATGYVSVTGRKFDDATVLKVADWLEKYET